MTLRTGALIAYSVLLATALGWCFEWQGGRLVLAVGLVLLSLVPVAYALWQGSRPALQRATLVLVVYLGIATVEVVATRRATWLPVVALYAALALLALMLAMLRRLPSSRGPGV